MISDSKYQQVAKELDVEAEAIKAVSIVESKGEGFLDGEPKILFEPHIFWSELKKRGIDPNKYTKGNEDILYEEWGEKPYGKYSEQHKRLQKAVKINKDAALSSASWGAYQVMGNNYKILGYNSLQDFINCAYESEDCQFDMFVRYIRANNLVRHLKTKNWASFALGYNGKGFKKNQYDVKMANEYKKLKG